MAACVSIIIDVTNWFLIHIHIFLENIGYTVDNTSTTNNATNGTVSTTTSTSWHKLSPVMNEQMTLQVLVQDCRCNL